MAEYIKRESLIENLNKFAPEQYNALVNMLIEKQPAADVVEVVRCKDCHIYNGHRYCTYFACTVFDDDFCSYGERKEGADNGI